MGMSDPLQAPTTQPQPGASAQMPGMAPQGMAAPMAQPQPPSTDTTKLTLGNLPPALLAELAAMLSKPANGNGVTQGVWKPQRPQSQSITVMAQPIAPNPNLSLGAAPSSDINQPMNPLDRSNRVM